MSVDAHESDWIYGLHDPGGEHLMAEAGTPGWVVYTAAVGQDPNDTSGFDFQQMNAHGVGVVCRINNGYYPVGTIPPRRYYDQFAQRCANFVAASPGCRIWIIGNEPNYSIERPHGALARSNEVTIPGMGRETDAAHVQSSDGLLATLLIWLSRLVRQIFGQADGSSQGIQKSTSSKRSVGLDGDPYFHGKEERFNVIYGSGRQDKEERVRRADSEEIWPEMYADCYRRCRNAIRSVPGHENDLVLTAAIAPWNNQTKYPGNPSGDWIQYFQDILLQLSPGDCDGIALHTYTHGPEPERITSHTKMDPPFQERHFEFRTYRDFLDAVPEQMRDLPVFIAETNQVDVWRDSASSWVEQAYAEIDAWNRMALTQKIACLVLYRWSDADKWTLASKPAVISDFRNAMQRRFARVASAPQASNWNRGQWLRTRTIVNLRRSAGYSGKNRSDIVAELPVDTRLQVTAAGHLVVDALNWWSVRVMNGAHNGKSGWVAETDPYQNRLVEASGEVAPKPDEGAHRLKVGELAHTTTIVRLRKVPGYVNKADDDIIADVMPHSTVEVLEGPSSRDELSWWRVRVQSEDPTTARTGWMAEVAPDGTVLLVAGAAPARPERSEDHYVPGDLTVTVNFVRLRQQPGFMNKPVEDIIADIWQGAPVRILDGPVEKDDLVWWMLETNDEYDGILRGWMADEAPNGIPLLQPLEPAPEEPFARGGLVVVGEVSVRIRREPGYVNAPEGDVLGEFRKRTVLQVVGDQRNADGLTWWRAAGIASLGAIQGWVAQMDPAGITLLRTAPRLPGTQLPNKQSRHYLTRPFDGTYGIGQLWGENASFYRRFTYDGVSLLGHNGIDFLTPMGTTVRATEVGTIATTGFQADGFGHFVLLNHDWGQSVYAHLSRVDVAAGQGVARGAVLGATGTSGNSTGPHLHFAIRIRPFDRADGWGGYSDPLPYLNPADVILPAHLYGNTTPDFDTDDELASAEPLPPSGIGDEDPEHKRP